ncbi:MAG: branched-chain amino acid ABC transporter permease [Candidatus Bathyarchaeia archaeon]
MTSRIQGTYRMKWLKPWYGLFLVITFFLVGPFFLPLSIMADVMVYSLAVLGFDLLWGHTGFLSFGHSAYFGIGTYGTAIFLQFAMFKQIPVPETWLWLAIPVGILVATAAGWFGGFLTFRARAGVYGTFVTIAIQFSFWWAMLKWYWVTGGENGIVNLPWLVFRIPGLPMISLQDMHAAYFFNLLIAIPALCIMYRIMHSPFGLILRSIRENEERVLFLGYNVHRYRMYSFILSALFCGIGGALYVNYYRFTGLHTIDWLSSGDLVIMPVLGGSGVYWGPIIGAFVFIMFKDYFAVYTWFWRLFVGGIAIIVMLFFRRGVWGLLERASHSISARLGRIG